MAEPVRKREARGGALGRPEVPKPEDEVRDLRPSWAAVLTGSAVGIGTWLLLMCLGLAIALWILPMSAHTAWVWTFIFTLVIPILSAAVGGFVGARAAGHTSRRGGVIHAAAIWGLSTLVGALLFALAGAWLWPPAHAPGAGGARLVPPGTISSLAVTSRLPVGRIVALNTGDILLGFNRELEAAGRPPINPARFEALLTSFGNSFWLEGNVNEGNLVQRLESGFPVGVVNARRLAAQVVARWYEIRPFIVLPTGPVVSSRPSVTPGMAPIGARPGAVPPAGRAAPPVPPGVRARVPAAPGVAPAAPAARSPLTVARRGVPLEEAMWSNEFTETLGLWFFLMAASIALPLIACLLAGGLGVSRRQRARTASEVPWVGEQHEVHA